MLLELLPDPILVSALGRAAEALPCPPAADRSFWEKFAGDSPRKEWRAELIRKAEALLLSPDGIWPPLRAEQAFRFQRDGNRTDYEDVYFLRRFRLAVLVLAECLEYRGRFLPQVIEGIWTLLGEPFWYVPAHGRYRAPDPMPLFDAPQTDLFAAETAMTLADTVRLLGTGLAAVSPELLRWVREEVRTRVIAPLEREGAEAPWWFGGRNNWTPWCSANVLGALFTFEENRERQLRIVKKLLAANERFLATYAEDGGCDEGPGYYQVAAVQLMQFLEPLDRLSGGALRKFWETPKMRNMSEYIVRVHLDGSWFASPADSGAKMTGPCNAGLLNRFGALTGSAPLRSFAAAAVRDFDPAGQPAELAEHVQRPLHSLLCNLLWVPTGRAETIRHPRLTRLDDLQFYVLRAAGSVATLKGGHNDENHNHLDVGQFELFRNGNPVIVDTGCKHYLRQTFSGERYLDWCYGFAGHNPPVFDGIGEKPGREAAARVTGVSESPLQATVEFAAAYPEGARVQQLCRTLSLAPDGTATVTDSVELSAGRRVTLTLCTPVEPDVEGNVFRLGETCFTFRGFEQCEIERVDLEDGKLRAAWGKRLYKLKLTGEFPAGRSSWVLEFSPPPLRS